MPLSAGQTILNGKYRILRLLGEGAAARVWLAEEPRFGGRQVAIKELRRDLLTPGELEEQERRFYQEVRLAALLEQAHAPHVVRALTVEELPDGARLLVMAYADGGSLADLLAQHPQGLPIDQAVGIAVQVAEALQALHSLPVEPVHRDVKPSNILLTSEGEALLGDFGLAQLAGASGRSLLSGGQHPGTPMTMAPEQERGAGYLTPAADVFALGCVLWEMLTGKRYKRFQPGTPPSQLRSDVPAWLDQVVMKALAEDAWNRWSSAGELARLLQAGAAMTQPMQPGRQPAQGAIPGVRKDDGTGKRRAAWLGWLAGAVALMAVVVMLFLTLKDGIGPEGDATATLTKPGLAVLGRTASPTRIPPTATVTGTPTSTLTPTVTDTATLAPTATFTATPTNQPTPTPAPTATSTPTFRISEMDGMEMVLVPAGEFVMGKSADDTTSRGDESPPHVVYLDSYWIDRTEITNLMFSRFVKDTGYVTEAEKRGYGWILDFENGGWKYMANAHWRHPRGPDSSIQGQDNHPVVQVSWNDADAYCKWAGRRLPTEAEWEKAARGTDERQFPWGSWYIWSDSANFADLSYFQTWDDDEDWISKDVDDGYGFTAPVGNYPNGISPYGAYDMAGNVWEWTSDKYSATYYEQSPRENPQGPSAGERRVIRGGSWHNFWGSLQSTWRYDAKQGVSSDDIGIRCAVSASIGNDAEGGQEW